MEFKKLIYLLILIVVLSGSLTYIAYRLFYTEIEIDEIGMDLIITDRKNAYGINIDVDAVHFGMLPLGAAATRKIDITNNYDYDIFVYIEKNDSILSGLVSISPNYFDLRPNEKRTVKASVSIPDAFEAGNYTGKIRIMMRVPFFRK